MKRRTQRALIFWILLVLIGVFALVINALIPIPAWIGWIVCVSAWVAAGVWIGLHFAFPPGGRQKKSASFAGNHAVFQRINNECAEALERYLGSVRRKGLLKKAALYERPWFLLCGPAQSGKTSLLRGSGVDFPVRYPSEKDGLVLEGASQLSWYFGNTAVWIDTPGSYMAEAGVEEWRATVAALARARPLNPVDGVAVVVSGPEIVAADAAAVKNRAAALRRRIDELIASWGIEFPVYLIFSRMDEVPGFDEFFGPVDGKNDQVFGATLGDDAQKMLPRQAFTREFRLLSASLAQHRLESLAATRDGGRKRLICRFAIHFDGMQEKLADFVTEIFKPSSYEGRPIFQGFYFASCRKTDSAQKTQPAAVQAVDLSQTIANHPLNPRRIAAAAQASGLTQKNAAVFTSFFVTPLFTNVMGAGDTPMVKHTQKRSRREMIRHYSCAGLICAAAIAAIVYIISSLGANRRLIADFEKALSQTGDVRSYADAYRRFGDIGRITARLQRYEDYGVPPSMGGWIYRGEKMLAVLRPEFFSMSQKLIIKPSVRYLEYRINAYCDEVGELSGEQHLGLYRSLKAYLSLSEAVANRTERIDTAFLREALVDAVTQTLLRAEDQSRLPRDIEAILIENLGLFLAYHKRGEFPLIQENQSMVSHARRRLQRLPDATTLYETVAGRISQDAPRISLADILGRSPEESILHSEVTISAVYTREGYERYMRDGIAEASKDPFKVDWVIGVSGDAMAAALPDPAKLRAQMTEAYFTDFTGKWLGFCGAVTMEPFGDLARSGRILKKLAGDQSELAVLLQAIGEYTNISEESSEIGGAGEKVLAAASKFKGTAALAKKAQTAKNAVDAATEGMSFRRKKGIAYLKRTFDPLRSFIQSSGGALGGYEGYRDRLLTLVEKIADIEQRGDNHAVAVFNGGDTDPLLSSWKFTQNTLSGMPDELSQALNSVLVTPLSYTGAAASKVLTEKLNTRWQDEVVKPFTSRFASRFPFSSSAAEEASFGDVMEFFRPHTGTLWGFYERVLSPFIVKTGTDWTVIGVGSLEINFNPGITSTFQNADRIRDIFFKADRTVRSISMTVTPLPRNKYRATIEVCGQVMDLPPGGQSAQFRWPIDAPSQAASLKAAISDDFTQDISFKGTWGLLRLLQKAKISVLNKSTFDATWEMNVQNMYMVYLTYRFQVSGADHPFSESVFEQFDCPTNLTIARTGENINGKSE